MWQYGPVETGDGMTAGFQMQVSCNSVRAGGCTASYPNHTLPHACPLPPLHRCNSVAISVASCRSVRLGKSVLSDWCSQPTRSIWRLSWPVCSPAGQYLFACPVGCGVVERVMPKTLAERQAAYVARKRRAGLCSICTRVAVSGRGRCVGCLERDKRASKARYRLRVSSVN